MFELTQRGRVAVLQMTHGKANAMDIEFCRALSAQVHACQQSAAGALVITGQGRMFSGGVDLPRLVAGGAAYAHQFLPAMNHAFEALFAFSKPLVVAVNGHAIAGGCVVAMACDLRVVAADPEIRVGLNETAVGLRYPPKVFAMVRQRVAANALDRVVLAAELHTPEAAKALGLVDEIAFDVVAAARAHLARLAAHPREAYARNKEMIRAGVLDVSEMDARRFREEVVPLWSAPETKERLLSVLKK
jgi:enoyl-CoA hydratase/carnithine racemase